ncbi:hypothetical protein ACWF9G_22815 [Nocardia sp. NPDC055029]
MLTVVGLIVFGVSLVALAGLLGAWVWLSSGRVLRVLGLVLIASNLYRLLVAVVFPWVLGSALRWLAVGALLWLVGHWVYLVRHRRARSVAAAHVFSLPGLRALVPAPAPSGEPLGGPAGS